ncbi:hypothetical protein Q7O_000027 [Pectobacterium carotovorum subsp. carotovorum PCCS1]|nr:hypothetical protein [Pectobacterium carotovorum subsp. carotovorum PCCS1]
MGQIFYISKTKAMQELAVTKEMKKEERRKQTQMQEHLSYT